MKRIVRIAAIGIAAFFVGACSMVDNPVSTGPVQPTVAALDQQSPDLGKGITFIKMPREAELRLAKLTASKYVLAGVGGTLSVNYRDYDIETGQRLAVKASIMVPPNALAQSTWLTMGLNEEILETSVDLTFGPHGVSFAKPALLNISAKGLDLSSVPADAQVNLYYFNETTGQFEVMRTEGLFVDLAKGILICRNGQLPHFSRYAFGYVR